MSSVFYAKWDSGKCPECGDPIEKGDEVSYSGQDLLHSECNYSPSEYYYDELLHWNGDVED